MHETNAVSLITEGTLDAMLKAFDEVENQGDMVTFGSTVTLRAVMELARVEVKRRAAKTCGGNCGGCAK